MYMSSVDREACEFDTIMDELFIIIYDDTWIEKA